MSFISVNNIWKSYGDNIVLERVNLEVEKGEFCTIVGKSGCGKSTFLRILLGEERPGKGSIRINGKPMPDQPDEDRGIVFQRYSVFPHLTVLQNVMLGLELEKSRLLGKVFGRTLRSVKDKAIEMIEAVGLLSSLNKYPMALSGGMQQRLAIAQSLIKKPEILLLDEPFGALDPGIRSDMHVLILKLWKQTQTTVFMVTHDINEGFHLGTRLLVFDKLRDDPHQPDAYGAGITYDLPLREASIEEQKDEIRSTLATAIEKESTLA